MSGQKCWRLSSRRNWMSGTRGRSLDFLGGLESALARRLELQIPQRMRRTRGEGAVAEEVYEEEEYEENYDEEEE